MIRYYYIFPAIYIIISLILLVQYISTTQHSSFSWGPLLQAKIQAKEQSLLKDRQMNATLPIKGLVPTSVQINFANLRFKFDRYASLSKYTQNIRLRSVLPSSHNEGLLLSFSEQVIVTFQASTLNPQELAITIKSFTPQKIAIPFSSAFGTTIKQDNNGIQISNSQKKYSFIPSFNASIKKIDNTWMLVSNKPYALFHLSEYTQDSIPVLATIPQTVPTPNFDTIFSNFLDKAYKGWLTTRYESASGRWLQPEGIYGFDENLLVAVYAEASRRKELATYKLAIERAAVLNQEALTWKAAPIAGTLPSNVLSQYTTQQKKLEYTVLTAMQDNTLHVFLNFNVLELAYIHFSETTKQKMLSYVQALSSIDIDIQTAISLLYQSEKTHWQEMATIIRTKQFELIQMILQNIVIANDGYMIRNTPNEISIMYTIIGGLYISQFATHDNEKQLGRRLISTALQLADDNGILPRIYVQKNKQFIPVGYINPEELYPFIIDNPAYPKVTRTKNIYAISNVPIAITKNNADEIQISIENINPNVTHYTYLWPITHTTRVFAFGTYWRGTYTLESLLQGISYNRTLESLLIKQKSKTPQAIIYLRF